MKNVITLGEALIDFTPLDEQNRDFRKNPGGAPANVAVALSRLGVEVDFIGKVGDDVLGRFMKDKLDSEGINTENMLLTKEERTALTFVTLDETGDRSFDFYIDPSADRFLKAEEIKKSLFQKDSIFHFGSISLIDQPARSATKKALDLACENGLIVSYDPNLRASLWSDLDEAWKQMTSVLERVDIVKLAKEELEFITKEKEVEVGLKKLKADYDIPLIFVTLGGEGACYYYQKELRFISGYEVEVVDTTGAGDAFVAGILYSLIQKDKDLTELFTVELDEITKFANASGALATINSGAMSGLPTEEDIKSLI